MEDLEAALDRPNLPAPLLVHPASVEAARMFLASRAPGTPAIADPDLNLYRAFGLKKGSFLQLFGPTVMWRGLRAMLRGHGIGKPTGNTLIMPGAFVVRGRDVLWQGLARHAGDHPDFEAIASTIKAPAPARTEPASLAVS